MTSAYILVAAVLILGGIIAALGDHLGSKVGKARLRLFKLRPRETAVVLTVLTGTLIAASTLLILFTFSKSLREGVFRLDDILKQLRTAQADLKLASQEKELIEQQLQSTKQQQQQVQKRSREINANYNQALQKLRQVVGQAQRLQRPKLDPAKGQCVVPLALDNLDSIFPGFVLLYLKKLILVLVLLVDFPADVNCDPWRRSPDRGDQYGHPVD